MARFTCARGLALGVLLASCSTANAASVTWLLEGTLNSAPTGIDISNLGIVANAGDYFSVRLTFDTSAPVTSPAACGINSATPGGPGTQCRHDGSTATAQFFSVIRLNNFTATDFRFPQSLNDVYYNQIIVRNNLSGFGPPEVDGYTWGTGTVCGFGLRACVPGDEADFANAIFRGAEDLNLVTDGRVLPAEPPPTLTSLAISTFQYCGGIHVAAPTANNPGATQNDCRFASIDARLTRVSRIAVPEPGTLALLGVGLAGLGLSRRRRVTA